MIKQKGGGCKIWSLSAYFFLTFMCFKKISSWTYWLDQELSTIWHHAIPHIILFTCQLMWRVFILTNPKHEDRESWCPTLFTPSPSQCLAHSDNFFFLKKTLCTCVKYFGRFLWTQPAAGGGENGSMCGSVYTGKCHQQCFLWDSNLPTHFPPCLGFLEGRLGF